ncbi:hypothetical protein KDA06_01360 [Candidatus Saccharibacteria bacterium]|jgi:hypothetical protein|nr:hypothetical protein [Candidatus Saccharibacteria bacterium]HPR09473.1 hypothetical protein [Candidatus Saccharibacteria bacterium]
MTQLNSLFDYTGPLSLGAFGLLCLGMIIIMIRSRRPQSLHTDYYQNEWKHIESRLKDKDKWALAIIEADDLLDHALRTRKYRGKTMGERLVTAQHDFSSNNTVWFAHKLRTKTEHVEAPKLNKTDVKDALLGIRQALRDIGALL